MTRQESLARYTKCELDVMVNIYRAIVATYPNPMNYHGDPLEVPDALDLIAGMGEPTHIDRVDEPGELGHQWPYLSLAISNALLRYREDNK